jgi:hypothetical protein
MKGNQEGNGAMKGFRTIILVMICLLVSGVQAVENVAVRWFDAEGVFHVGDPLPYINDVLTGNIPADNLAGIFKSLSGDEPVFPASRLEALSWQLLSSGEVFTVCVPGSKEIKKSRKHCKKIFKKGLKTESRGTLSVVGLGVQKQGSTSYLAGSDVNTVTLIPYDPLLVSHIPIPSPSAVKTVESLLDTARSKTWKKFAITKTLDLRGHAELDKLVPGSWLVWINQFNMLTYLYRVQINEGENTVLKATQPFARCFIHPVGN